MTTTTMQKIIVIVIIASISRITTSLLNTRSNILSLMAFSRSRLEKSQTTSSENELHKITIHFTEKKLQKKRSAGNTREMLQTVIAH